MAAAWLRALRLNSHRDLQREGRRRPPARGLLQAELHQLRGHPRRRLDGRIDGGARALEAGRALHHHPPRHEGWIQRRRAELCAAQYGPANRIRGHLRCRRRALPGCPAGSALPLLQPGKSPASPPPRSWCRAKLSMARPEQERKLADGRGTHRIRRQLYDRASLPAGPGLDEDDRGHRLHDQGGSLEGTDRKSTRLNSSHVSISYAVFCLKKKKYRTTLFYELSS